MLLRRLLVPALCAALSTSLLAQEARPEIRLSRAAGEITVDGELGDPGWQGATRIDTFYETNPGDNVPPKVQTVAWLTYDDRFFYAAFDFSDDPRTLRAPLGDRDNVPSSIDYGGVILDTRNDGKTAVMMLVNPSNIQYDALTSDATGEDSSYDLYWDSATRIYAGGWRLEIRVPFSSLRYTPADPQVWGIMLYRNRPRDFRYQIFNVRLPRDSNCFVCNRALVTGLERLPTGGHVVLAPYATANQVEQPEAGLGTPLAADDPEADGGLDAKWTPNADTAIDLTWNPDFSQIESDVAQISVNERFALFVPEKRPFFLEGLDLFSTPIQAVYTRTVTEPRWGGRATGQLGGTVYTFLVTEDEGGGSVILPGPENSSLGFQDFPSYVVIGRVRRDFGGSFASFLLTGREIEDGGYNRVVGPDFQWRPSGSDAITGQFLWSDTRTPDRPDLGVEEWDGRDLQGHALYLNWQRNKRTYDWNFEYKDIGDDFRADNGFLPQVGVRDSFVSFGRPFYPESGPLRDVRPFLRVRHIADQEGDLVLRRYVPGIQLQGFWSSYINLEQRWDRTRVGSEYFDYDYTYFEIDMTPAGWLRFGLYGTLGEDVDFDNVRPGWGGLVNANATVRPTDHLELLFNGSRRWVDVTPDGGGGRRRLFTAEVARLRATYTFTSRMFLRLVGQQVTLDQDPDLYGFAVDPHSESVTASALFAYKINWQTVLYLGYGDDRAFEERTGRLEPARRELFLKVSYAFQR
ncbi:MAG TPA: DUF5916 domain-containing protein [Thermoanaerobaculia bacterium]|nr:DUF5916 domain-containing protein [Thermoanaerobaculia bacterium]